jgi:hypothetical protein
LRRGGGGASGATINFVRLSTDINATTPISATPVTVTAKIDTVIFEGAVSHLVIPTANFNIIGGVRTYTLSPQVDFTGTGSQPSFDVSRKTWAGLLVGYHALGSDTGSVPTSGPVVEKIGYEQPRYARYFAFTFHWKQK